MNFKEIEDAVKIIVQNIKKSSTSNIDVYAKIQTWHTLLVEYTRQLFRYREGGNAFSRHYEELLLFFNVKLGAPEALIQYLKHFNNKSTSSPSEMEIAQTNLEIVKKTLEGCLKNDLKIEAEQESIKLKENLDTAIFRVTAEQVGLGKTIGTGNKNNLDARFEAAVATLKKEAKVLTEIHATTKVFIDTSTKKLEIGFAKQVEVVRAEAAKLRADFLKDMEEIAVQQKEITGMKPQSGNLAQTEGTTQKIQALK